MSEQQKPKQANAWSNGNASVSLDKSLQAKLLKLLDVRIDFHNIFVLPWSLERAHVEKMGRCELGYMVTEKTDGLRYMLSCTTQSSRPHLMLFNRAFDMLSWEDKTPQHSLLFTGTMIDGEIIQDRNKRWNFVAFDCLAINGAHIHNMTFAYRLQALQRAVKEIKDVIKHLLPDLTICMKDWHPLTSLSSLSSKGLNQSQFPSDGLVFMPSLVGASFGTSQDVLKWKPVELITIDFQVTTSKPGTYVLHVCDKGRLVCMSKLRLKPSIRRSMMDNWLKRCHIIEFRWDYCHQCWQPVKPREDKNFPNNFRTYSNTVNNLQEAITLEELCTFFS